MKKGINIWSFPPGMKIIDCIGLAKDAGFEGIELALNETGEMSLESSEDEIRSYKSAAEKLGIKISSLATGLYWLYSLTSNMDDIREKAKEIVRKQIYAASVLGTDTILVVPGAVGVDFKPEMVVPDFSRSVHHFAGLEVIEYDIAYERALHALKEMVLYAEEKRVTIGIENVWNKFLLSPLEMRDFIDKIGSDYIGVYFDVGNIINSGYPEHWIKILGQRIKMLHFKDYRREAGGLAGFVDLLAGDVNYLEVVKRLKEIGYDGFVNAEMTPVYRNYPEQIIFNTSKSMDRILGN